MFMLYKINGEQARFLFDKLVHQDTDHELREKLVQNIKDEFDRMDGKPTKKEAELARREEETQQNKRQQQEVEELQKKLAEAKALNKQVRRTLGTFYKGNTRPFVYRIYLTRLV